MSSRAYVTGQFGIQDESTNVPTVATVDLSKVFGQLSSVKESKQIEREIVDTAGVVAISDDGVTTMRGVLITVSGAGSLLLKHDGNLNGITITQAMLLFGNISAITLETTATQAIVAKLVFFE